MATLQTVRSFVGIAVTDMGLANECVLQITRYAAQDRFSELRWTPQHFLHLTLAFLGNQPPPLLDALGRLLAQALRGHTTFPLEMQRCGSFPEGSSRILAALPVLSPTLQHLHETVKTCVKDVGLMPEARPFLPHVTLGRVIRDASFSPFSEPFRACGTVGAVSLYRSELVAAGSHYTPLQRWSLQRPGELPR